MVVEKPPKKAVHSVCAAFFICLAVAVGCFSCSSVPEMASEDWYFAALKEKEAGNRDEAIRLFTEGKKNGNELLAPLCQAELLQLVPAKQLAKEKKYARKHFAGNEEIERLLSEDGVAFRTGGDSVASSALTDSALQPAFDYAAKKDWTRAYEVLATVLPPFEEPAYLDYLLRLSADEFSTVGKIFLYGYGDKLTRARQMASCAEAVENADAGAVLSDLSGGPDRLFLLQFYTGRLYVYAGRQFYDTACKWLSKAMETAPTAARYDNALWYLLDTRRKQSVSTGIAALAEYAHTWNDPSYFDDFLEDLCADLCNKGQWNTLFQVLESSSAYMTVTVQVQYTYICGRAVETGLVSAVPAAEREKMAETLLNKAWNLGGGSVYYRMLLAERLGKQLFTTSNEDVLSESVSQDLQIQDLLLSGYIRFGLYDRILPLCSQYSGTFNPALLEVSLKQLSLVAAANPEYAPVALRAASYATGWGENKADFDSRFLPYVFPRYHEDVILSAADEFGLDASLLFGVIRSESYFDASVVSHAGAIGLSQLMPLTAGDVARKLKVSDYELTDPAINARFGAFYLEELVRRLDGDVLLASLSYNAGITNVRNWRRSFASLPHDLFLEAVPFEETRGYGRKITTAYGLYAMIYDSASTHEIVQKLLR